MAEPRAPLPVATSLTVPATAAICPFLLSTDGSWRASTPTRDHRCTAVAPPAPLAADKQRRLCLNARHMGCATYQAAAGTADLGSIDGAGRVVARPPGPTRPLARTTPVVLDHGRISISAPSLRGQASLGQGALIGLMAIAFAAILVARISTGGSDPSGGRLIGAAVGDRTPAPSERNDPAEPERTAVAEAPSRTLVPTEVDPTEEPDETAEPEATPSDEPAEDDAPRTYKVRRGDTLSGIAAEFDTTVRKLVKLNKITDPSRLKIGQVLELP